MKKADLALYATKSAGRNDFRIFEPELTAAEDHQKKMEIGLREALAQNQFELHYQPIVDLGSGRFHGMEAFVRWRHPSRGLLAPDQFLRAAESSGLMVPLGEWILQQACTDAATWPAHVALAINVSAMQLRKENVFDVILCALVDSGLAPERLEIEIADVDKLDGDRTRHLQTIRQLKNIGVSIVLDDCGSAHSSASYLTAFPFDNVKINKPFTQGIVSRRDCAAVVRSVVALAHGLDVTTTAKGVETSAQLEALRAAGVDRAQGFLFGRPAAQFELDFEATTGMAVAARDVA
jgi:EAL domain-containing protein (putative c-di-GMP-specific phosphodiesterase class I)